MLQVIAANDCVSLFKNKLNRKVRVFECWVFKLLQSTLSEFFQIIFINYLVKKLTGLSLNESGRNDISN